MRRDAAAGALVVEDDKAGAPAAPAPVPLLLSQLAAIKYVGLSRSAWYRLRSVGKLPRPVSVPGCGPHWRRADLDRWAENVRPAGRQK
jgi:predicted DNA-binding transcriptional regulator AlpA